MDKNQVSRNRRERPERSRLPDIQKEVISLDGWMDGWIDDWHHQMDKFTLFFSRDVELACKEDDLLAQNFLSIISTSPPPLYINSLNKVNSTLSPAGSLFSPQISIFLKSIPALSPSW